MGPPEPEAPLIDPYREEGVAAVPAAAAPDRPKPDRRPQRLLIALTTAALSCALVTTGVALWGLHQWGRLAGELVPSEGGGQLEAVQQAAHPAAESAPSPSPSAAASSAPALGPQVPQTTKSEIRGVVELVDIGMNEPQLAAALTAQRAEALAKKQTMVVMLNGRSCAPCRGVDAALEDVAMQRALAGVRIVRIDLDVFREELVELRLPHDLYPAFFLLAPDLRPLDAIHGGEWDEDTPANIAPVLGAFVRGQLKKRRHHWAPVARSIEL